MSVFKMCRECEAEYTNPENRRFHAQPNACPVCGPQMKLYDKNRNEISSDIEAIAQRTIELLSAGSIVAIKGIGGYHLAADAKSDPAVEALRNRKRRPFKPFALMASSIESIKSYAHITKREEELLLSRERPIVLLKLKDLSGLSKYVAPGLTYLGFMLPYTPFQHHIFSLRPDMALVMTSGNVSDEPIIYQDDDAFKNLSRIADYIVSYNRDILAQSDDSVLFVEKERMYFIRRARGFVPAPFDSRHTAKNILSMGGDLKNSFAIARKNSIIVSQYLGDMADIETHRAFRNTVGHYIRIFDAKPELIVSDMHPNYMTTQFADELSVSGIERISVQHHHAHIASVLEDCNLDEEVIGIAFDGTGYGNDGNLWGSEFLIAGRRKFTRAGAFSYFPLPGGESAIKDVWKIGAALLYRATGSIPEWFAKKDESGALMEIIDKNINCPLTCSIGRIFDGVSAILGVARSVSSEAEAAIMLEELAYEAKEKGDGYIIPFSEDDMIVMSTEELVKRIYAEIISGKDRAGIAYSFHKYIADTSVRVAGILRHRTGIKKIALSGGVFHNRLLLNLMTEGLSNSGFEIFLPRNVPFNDGCISLGQICIAKELAG